MSDKKKDLALLIRKYKNNKQKVSPEDLKGKYKAAFDKLKTEIHDLAGEYLWDIVFGDMEDTRVEPELFKMIEDYVEKSNINYYAGMSAFSKYDVDAIESLGLRFKKEVEVMIKDFRKEPRGGRDEKT